MSLNGAENYEKLSRLVGAIKEGDDGMCSRGVSRGSSFSPFAVTEDAMRESVFHAFGCTLLLVVKSALCRSYAVTSEYVSNVVQS